MNWLSEYLNNLTTEQITFVANTYWIVPAGVLALYFYGAFHFNTPDYRLAAFQSVETPPLLTMAPPKFTTTRGRFRRYAIRYILILEAFYLTFVFFTDIYLTVAKLLGISAQGVSFGSSTTAVDVQHKALFALFFLTGLLSSFPFFRDIDAWILRQLHHAALIPDDARLLASRLFESAYRPSDRVRTQVRQLLQSRDTIRFAEDKISGSLERRVVNLLWLHARLKENATEPGHEFFTVRFEADLADVARTVLRMKNDLIQYFKDQARLVPDEIYDIDQFFVDRADNADAAALATRREDLLRQCEGLYYRVCLLTSVLAYSTESTAEHISDLLTKLGFAVKVHANPIMDWDAVLRVIGTVFVLTAVANITFMTLSSLFGIELPMSGRRPMFIFAATTTLMYLITIYASLKVKRRSRRTSRAKSNAVENPKIAVLCYVLTLPITVTLSLWYRHELTIAPFLFASIQGIVGYFVATYVDRSLVGLPFSWRLAWSQAGCQAIAAALIFWFLPPLKGFEPTTLQNGVFDLVFIVQMGLSGLLVGSVFQYFYRRTKPHEGTVVGDMTVEALQLVR